MQKVEAGDTQEALSVDSVHTECSKKKKKASTLFTSFIKVLTPHVNVLTTGLLEPFILKIREELEVGTSAIQNHPTQ